MSVAGFFSRCDKLNDRKVRLGTLAMSVAGFFSRCDVDEAGINVQDQIAMSVAGFFSRCDDGFWVIFCPETRR